MKKVILLLQFRTNNVVARHEKNCILRAVDGKIKIISKNAFREKIDFPQNFITQIVKIIIGGSGEFSFSRKKDLPDLWEKVKKTTPFLKKAIKANIPILGICFGHQLLAHILGSAITDNKRQREVGVSKIFLTPVGKRNFLFKNAPLSFKVQEGHEDSVMKLPKRAKLLAKSERCKIQAFCWKNIYGVQFHPELSSIKDIKIREKFYPNYSYSVSERTIKPSPSAKKVLRNFLIM